MKAALKRLASVGLVKADNENWKPIHAEQEKLDEIAEKTGIPFDS